MGDSGSTPAHGAFFLPFALCFCILMLRSDRTFVCTVGLHCPGSSGLLILARHISLAIAIRAPETYRCEARDPRCSFIITRIATRPRQYRHSS